jgi:hypothetical protein
MGRSSFGPFTFDSETLILQRDGEIVLVQPQTVKVLRVLWQRFEILFRNPNRIEDRPATIVACDVSSDLFTSALQKKLYYERHLSPMALLRLTSITNSRLVWGLFIFPCLSSAATWTVVNSNDSGAGSLRNAISAAGTGDSVNFNLTYPAAINLSSGGLAISHNVTIVGPGSSSLTISGSNLYTVLTVASGVQVNLSGVTLTSGQIVGIQGTGGAILNSGVLTISDSTISNSYAGGQHVGMGGGIYNANTLTMIHCSVVGNSASTNESSDGNGGGLANIGTMTLIDSIVSGNSGFTASGGGGGGIFNSGILALSNTALSENNAAYGGAIYNVGTLTVNGGNFTGNSVTATPPLSPASGGAIYNRGNLTLTGSTLSGNSASQQGVYGVGGGIANYATAVLLNSTLAGNSSGSCVLGCTVQTSGGAGLYNDGYLTLTHSILSGNFVSGGNNGSGILSGHPQPLVRGTADAERIHVELLFGKQYGCRQRRHCSRRRQWRNQCLGDGRDGSVDRYQWILCSPGIEWPGVLSGDSVPAGGYSYLVVPNGFRAALHGRRGDPFVCCSGRYRLRHSCHGGSLLVECYGSAAEKPGDPQHMASGKTAAECVHAQCV